MPFQAPLPSSLILTHQLPASFTFVPPGHGTVPKHTSCSLCTGHTATIECHTHASSRHCSQRSFCQKHLVLPVEKSCSSCKAQIWHHLLWETPQDPPMHRPLFHYSTIPCIDHYSTIPWYLGEGPKFTSQPLCPCPSTCSDQISLGLSLISELSEPVPSGPSDSPEAQILGG